MSQIMKAFMGLFLVLFLMSTSAGILSAFMVVVEAQDMHAQIIDEMENSNFNLAVMKSWFDKANEVGYDLSITFYHDDKTEVICTSATTLPQSTADVSFAKLELSFPFQVHFFGINSWHTLCAYAR